MIAGNYRGTTISRLIAEGLVGSPGLHIQQVGRCKRMWNGEGLPPAGMKCEVLNSELSDPKWEKCVILFAGNHRIMYDSESCLERVGYVDQLQFRPTRTPEQIAADEREAAIEEMRKLLSKVPCDDYHAAVAMYDAGYRKQPDTK